MPLKARDVDDKLIHKFGFSLAKNKGKDHVWYELTVQGLPTIFTKISHGAYEIYDPIIGYMARECLVKTPFFKEMIQCTKSLDDFISQITTDPYPPTNHRH